jgi:F1F0 ATPase subunit 2
MNELTVSLLSLTLSLLVGLLLGAVFFGGLWWTVRRAVSASQPALWVLGSFVARTTFTLLGFTLVSRHQPARLVVCLAGFVVARFVVTRLTRSTDESERADGAGPGVRLTEGAHHEPQP